MSLSHDSGNPNKSYIVLFDVREWSYISIEVQIPSLRVALTTEMMGDKKHQLRLQELEVLDDKLLQAQ